MTKLISPICLTLALFMAVIGFGLCAWGIPEAPIELHAARAAGDEATSNRLEDHWHGQQWQRRVLIGGLFTGSAVMFAMAYLLLGSRRPGNRNW